MPAGNLDSFEAEKSRLNLCEARDLGLMPVEVSKIMGSLGRWRDFDAKFRLKNMSTRQRYQVILQKMREGHVFPPIHLYKVQDKYYVADGNHRVAAAKAIGAAYIDAHVQEYFPCDDKDGGDAIYWRERSAFEVATAFTAMDFTNPDSYRRLLSHLETFRMHESERLGYGLGLPETLQIWLKEIDGPIRALVRSEGLAERFPGRTPDDLVFYVIHHHVGLLRAVKGPENIRYRECIARLLASPGRTVMGRLKKFARQLQDGARMLFETGPVEHP